MSFLRLIRAFRPPTVHRFASPVAIQAARHRRTLALATAAIGIATYLAFAPNQIHLDGQLQPKQLQDVVEETVGM